MIGRIPQLKGEERSFSMRSILIGLILVAAGTPALSQQISSSHELIVHWSGLRESTEYRRVYASRDQCERARGAILAEQHRKLIFEGSGQSANSGGMVVIVPGTAPFTVCLPVN